MLERGKVIISMDTWIKCYLRCFELQNMYHYYHFKNGHSTISFLSKTGEFFTFKISE